MDARTIQHRRHAGSQTSGDVGELLQSQAAIAAKPVELRYYGSDFDIVVRAKAGSSSGSTSGFRPDGECLT